MFHSNPFVDAQVPFRVNQPPAVMVLHRMKKAGGRELCIHHTAEPAVFGIRILLIAFNSADGIRFPGNPCRIRGPFFGVHHYWLGDCCLEEENEYAYK